MTNDYQTWCNKTKWLSPYLAGRKLVSDNLVRLVTVEDNGGDFLLKIISTSRPYVNRIKALGEVAYALFDWYLNAQGRVTPNVYAASPATIWRQFIPGTLGEEWRGELYMAKGSIETADLIIAHHISENPSAERIALLDFVFLCQDRSANNWLRAADGRFYAFDNGMFWPYKGRFADKLVVESGTVGHLRPPMEALVSGKKVEFGIGLFSSLYAGQPVDPQLMDQISEIYWNGYLTELAELVCEPLGYPFEIIGDWRFDQVHARAEWILNEGRFPGAAETQGKEWQALIDKPADGKGVWKRQWEISNLETI